MSDALTVSRIHDAQERALAIRTLRRLGSSGTKDIDLAGAFYEGGGEIGINPVWYDMQGQGDRERDTRIARATKSGRGNSATFALLASFARACKEPSPFVFRGPWMDLEKSERLDDHPATRATGILRRPNSAAKLTMTQLQEATAKGKLAGGNFYWVIARSGGGTVLDNTTGAVARLWPVWHGKMMPAVYTPADGKESNGWIDYYAYHVGKGKPLQVPMENVIHFRNGLSDDDPRLGIGVVEEFALEVASDVDAALLTQAVYRNLGLPGLVFSPEPPSAGPGGMPGGMVGIPPEDRAAIKASVTAKTTGSKRGEAIVLSRPTRFEQFKVDLQQYNLDHVYNHVETRMSGVIGWPAILAGLQSGLDAATYANVASLRRFATENAALPTWIDDSETLTLELGPSLGLRDDEWIAYDYRSVRALQEDRGNLWTWANDGFERDALTIGEHHRLLDMELPEGVDPDLRRSAIVAGSQLAGLLGPVMGKTRSFIVDGSVVRAAPVVLEAGDIPTGQKALALPATVTIDEGDIEDAARDWDKWAGKHAPELVGIMDAVVEEDGTEEETE